MLGALAVSAAALALAPRGALGAPWEGIAFACAALLWVQRQPLDGRRDDVLPALAILLSALGLTVVARLSSDLAHRQVIWLALSLLIAIAAGPLFDRFRVLSGYRYLWVLGSIVLFALVAIFGQEVNGARLWISVAGVEFEPIEIIKLFIVLFMAGYLAQTADVIAAAKPWSLRANAKYLGPLILGWGISTAILLFEHDIGMAALLLLIFVAMLYVATRRLDLVIGAIGVFGGAVVAAARLFPYVAARFDVWLHPLADPLGRGYQALQGNFSLAAGGVFGTGYGLGRPDFIPSVATDYIYAAWSEEFGLLGALAVLAAFALLVHRALLAARRASDLYAKLLAVGLAATIGFQVCIIVSGVLGLFPLTGITLPFFSYGGSSLVANYLLVAALWAVAAERRTPLGAEDEGAGAVELGRRSGG